VICGPIGCAVDFLCRLLHLKIILLKKPLRTALCNKATINYLIYKYKFNKLNNEAMVAFGKHLDNKRKK
ncbi:hypothetical protein Q4405_20835, partial [Acinetobacter baumannii]